MAEWKIPVSEVSPRLRRAVLDEEEREDADRYLLTQWREGTLSTREAAEGLGIGVYEFTELASRLGYSLVPSGPNTEAIQAYKRRTQADR